MRRFSGTIPLFVLISIGASSPVGAEPKSAFIANQSVRSASHWEALTASMAGNVKEKRMAAAANAFLRSLQGQHSLSSESWFTNPRVTRVSDRFCRRYAQTFREKRILGSLALICFDGSEERTASAICDENCLGNVTESGSPMTDEEALRAAWNGIYWAFEARGKERELGSFFRDAGVGVEPVWIEDPDAGGLIDVRSVSFVTVEPYGKYTVYVHGETGDLIAYENHVLSATGSGNVFFRDAVTTPQLTLQSLKNLTRLRTLATDRIMIVNEDTGSATEESGEYFFDVGSTHFDEVQAFFGMQLGLEKLGDWGFVPGRPLQVWVHYGRNFNNAFYDGTKIALGDGDGSLMRDLAQDNTVVIHETGHWVVDDLSPIASNNYYGDGGALHEGYADYIGCAVYESPFVGQGVFMDTARYPYLRACNTNLPFDQKDGEVHDAGQVWSGAAWEARGRIGGLRMDPLVVQSLQRIQPTGYMGSVTMDDAYRGLLTAAEATLEGEEEAIVLRTLGEVFEARGFGG